MARRKKDQIPPKLREKVFKRDNYTCRYCGTTEGPFHCDHVYPESQGGKTVFNNLATACKRCNLKKYNKIGVWPASPDEVSRMTRAEARMTRAEARSARERDVFDRRVRVVKSQAKTRQAKSNRRINDLEKQVEEKQQRLDWIRAWYATDGNLPPKVFVVFVLTGFFPLLMGFVVKGMPVSPETGNIIWVAAVSPVMAVFLLSYTIFTIWRIRVVWRMLLKNIRH